MIKGCVQWKHVHYWKDICHQLESKPDCFIEDFLLTASDYNFQLLPALQTRHILNLELKK